MKGKQLSEFLVNRLNELADSIVQDKEQLNEFVKRWKNGFYTYSLNNTLLILAQRPDATLLAGYRQWQRRNRYVKKGSRSIRILAPLVKKIKEDNGDETIILKGFKPVSIFDVKDTDGEKIRVGCSDLISGDIDFQKVKNACKYPVYLKELGLANGSTDGKRINISPKVNQAAMVATLIHEWAHCDLGHCNQPGILFETDDRSAHEIEAESVSYIVSCVIGLENNRSALYIGNWHGNKEKLRGHGKKIIATAEKIIRVIISQGAD
jgi:hypothetical protein